MTDIAAEALVGPWQAVLADIPGNVVDIDDPSLPLGEANIGIVRRTALPATVDGTLRLRTPCDDGDILHVWGDFDTWEDVRTRWVQAQAMAAGLNAAAKGGVR